MLRPPSAGGDSDRSTRSKRKRPKSSRKKKSASKAKLSSPASKAKLSTPVSQKSIKDASKTLQEEEKKVVDPVSSGKLLKPSTDTENKFETAPASIKRDSTNRSGLSVRTKLAIDI